MSNDREPMTIDALASIYRVESKSKALSDIRKDFYPAVTALSDSVRKEYDEELKRDSGSFIYEGINERRKRITLHCRNIVDLRMEKIAKLALLGAMGGDNSIENLTVEEKDYYSIILDASRRHRALAEHPRKPKTVVLNVEQKPAAVTNPVTEPVLESPEPPMIIEPELPVEEWVPENVPEEPEDEESVTIRILEDLPRFSGPDKDYDLKKEDIVRMPVVMANALITREKAVKIQVTP